MSTSQCCPVCNLDVATSVPSPNGQDATKFDCQFCGKFSTSNNLLAELPEIRKKCGDSGFRISHAIRSMAHRNKKVELNTTNIEVINEKPLPRPREQADLLIRWIAEHVGGPGKMVKLAFLKQGAFIGSKSREGFLLIVNYLLESNLIKGDQKNSIDLDGVINVTLTFSGWDRYEELRLGRLCYRRAFMAMAFGNVVLDTVVDTIFKDSARRAGFDLFRVDEINKAGLIDDHIRSEIQSSDFLVADLTHDNHGAYWEAGYAEGLGKPVIYTCERNKFEDIKTHFDTNHHLTIKWDISSLQEAGKHLKDTIRATLPHLALLQDPSE